MEENLNLNNSSHLRMTTEGLCFNQNLICAAFEVKGLARSDQGDAWSWLVSFNDRDNKPHKLLITSKDLIDSKSLIEKLSFNGLAIYLHSRKDKIAEFISNSDVTDRFLIMNRSGWHGFSFYMPNSNTLIAIDKDQSSLNAMSLNAVAKNSINGSLEDWNNKLGYLLKNNSNLTLATTTALAAPLLKIFNIQNFGYNFVGKSSIGKSSILELAASIVGDTAKTSSNYVNSFRTTDNALESICYGHNDFCLILDELGQLDPYKANDVFYMLGNGTTKSRSSKTGELQEKRQFNLTVLGSSEITLNNLVSLTGKKVKAGLEVRFIDINADVGCGFGIYEDLHGFKGGKELSDYIKLETKNYFGSVFDTYIRILVSKLNQDADSFLKDCLLHKKLFIEQMPISDNPMFNRIMQSISINYLAGLIAIDHKILNLDKLNMFASFYKIACQLQEKLGHLHKEDSNILNTIADFILKHERSRFADELDFYSKVPNCVGFKKRINGELYFCFYTGFLEKEVCTSWSKSQIKSALVSTGFLSADINGKYSQVFNMGSHSVRAYPISSKILEWSD